MTRSTMAVLMLAAGGCGSTADAIVDAPYHRAGQAVATNFIAHADGTFEWKIDGCDFGGGDVGQWEDARRDVVVTPVGGSMRWPAPSPDGSSVAVRRVVLTLRDDESVIDAVVTQGDSDFQQRWVEGGVCAACAGAGQGPAPCDDPFCS